MRVSERVYWIGSGLLGMNASDDWDCNIYLLDGGSEQAIVDCGSGYGIPNILEELKRDGFNPDSVRYLLLTHAHMDHAGGVAALRQRTGAQVVASRLSAPLIEGGDEDAIGLTGARAAGVYPPDSRFAPCRVDVTVQHAQSIQVGDLTVDVIETPGHSRDMVGYYCREIRTLFSGDSIFAGGRIAAIQTDDFSMDQLSESLSHLARLEVESLMPGHLTPVVRNGGRPIRQAVDTLRRGGIPESIV